MPLQSSGPISLNEIHIEAGGASGTTASINDADIRALIGKSSGATMSFNEWYGASANAFPGSGEDSWFTNGFSDLPTAQQFSQSITNATYAAAGCTSAYQNDTANDRIASRTSGYTSAAAQVYTYDYIGYDGHASTTFQAKCDYSVSSSGFVGSVQNPASFSPATGVWTNISTSSYSPMWLWEATVSSPSTGTRSLSSLSGTSPDFSVRAGSSGSGISGTARPLSLSATRGTQGGPPGGPEICIHEDMLVSTQNGQESIHTVKDSVSKIWAWNNETSSKELVDLLQIIIINHDNLYTVNNLKLTEDHPVYLEGYVRASIDPARTLENYELTVAQLAVGDKMIKEDGTLETVTSIEVLAEEHVTYTLKTEHGNFYANGYLVDSEI
jgi:hypothetical protein